MKSKATGRVLGLCLGVVLFFGFRAAADDDIISATVHSASEFESIIEEHLFSFANFDCRLDITFAADFTSAPIDIGYVDFGGNKVVLDASACRPGQVVFENSGVRRIGNGSEVRNITFQGCAGRAVDCHKSTTEALVRDCVFTNSTANMLNNCKVVENCRFIDCTVSANFDEAGIPGPVGSLDRSDISAVTDVVIDSVSIKNCEFIRCHDRRCIYFSDYNVSDCAVTDCTFTRCNGGKPLVQAEWIVASKYGPAITRCVFTGCNATVLLDVGNVEDCRFVDIGSSAIVDCGDVTGCEFTNVGYAIDDALDVTRCVFTNIRSGAIIDAQDVSNCQFLHCSTSKNEGAAIKGADAVSDCRFEDCAAYDHDGGAVSKAETVNNCTFKDCWVDDGGDGGAVKGVATVSNCRFENCWSVEESGGACYKVDKVVDSYFSNCSAHMDGGGAISGDTDVYRCQFYNCTSTNNYGGAIQGGGIIVSCLFVDCTAKCGGAISEFGSGGDAVQIAHCTFVRCKGGVDDEAIYERDNGHTLKVYDSIFYGCDRWVDTDEIDYFACCYHIDTTAFFMDYANGNFHPSTNMPVNVSMGQGLYYQKPGSGSFYEIPDLNGSAFNGSWDWENCPGCYRYRNQREWERFALGEMGRVDPFTVSTVEDIVDPHDDRVSFREAVKYLTEYTGTVYSKSHIIFAVRGEVRLNSPIGWVTPSAPLTITGSGEPVKIVFAHGGSERAMSLSGDITIRNLEFSAPNLTDAGEVVLHAGGGSFTVEDCRFHDCVTDPLISYSTDTTISRCTFDHNTSSINGAGLYLQAVGSRAVVEACTFCSNRCTNAGYGGAGVSVGNGSSVRCVNCTFTGNHASVPDADDFYNHENTDPSTMTLVNCISTGSYDPSKVSQSSCSLGVSPTEVFETGAAVSKVFAGVTRIGYRPKLSVAGEGEKVESPQFDVFMTYCDGGHYARGSYFVNDEREDFYVNPFVVTTSEDVVDPYDGKISFREAIRNLKEYDGLKYSKGVISFDPTADNGQVSIDCSDMVRVENTEPLVIDGQGVSVGCFCSGDSVRSLELTGGKVTLKNLDFHSVGMANSEAVVVYSNSNGCLNVENCRFESCLTCPLVSCAKTTTVSRCTFDHNESEKNGAGLTVLGEGTVSVKASTFCDNTCGPSCPGSAGLTIGEGVSAVCVNCTFTGNRASWITGADDFCNLNYDQKHLTMTNCITTGSFNRDWITAESSSLGGSMVEVFASGVAVREKVEGVSQLGYIPRPETTARNGIAVEDPDKDVFGVVHSGLFYSRGSYFVNETIGEEAYIVRSLDGRVSVYSDSNGVLTHLVPGDSITVPAGGDVSKVASDVATALAAGSIDWYSPVVNSSVIGMVLNDRAAPVIAGNADTDLTGDELAVYVMPENVKRNLYYALESSETPVGPYVIDRDSWRQADALGQLALPLVSAKVGDKRFYRVVVRDSVP